MSPAAHFARFTTKPGSPFAPLRHWAPSLGIWGFSAGSAALLVLAVTPLVRREILVKVPVLQEYYIDKTPDSDKPF
ncbi:ubiquinol-cytochrome-c reductase complex subunit-domain-containing protein [Flagelloscypha sp. PMI_526]|nr:ubiquinol-cytochrome-c reductase complex subunit-domain-containing protein [Flagelloscypha sp. PMI_526]